MICKHKSTKLNGSKFKVEFKDFLASKHLEFYQTGINN